ncbi:MAG: hypothetical protein KBD60_14305, partial [Sterolibacterium sp.]|nr:hypothetical protein [Sterolibacterium sp.]
MADFNPDDLLTARGRAKLKPRPQNAPYFRMLSKGQHIGFRPSESGGPGAWVLRYRHPDTSKVEHVALGAFATYDEAKAEAESLLSKIIKGVDVKAKPTVKQACQEYIEHKRQRAGDTKAEEYRERLERYMFFADDVDTSKVDSDDPRRIGAIQLAKLRRQDVETWFASISKGRAPATANRYFNDLRAALNLALKNSLVASDAAWQIDKHSNAERARVDAYLTKRERKLIIDSLN